jgi:hypothetical protein
VIRKFTKDLINYFFVKKKNLSALILKQQEKKLYTSLKPRLLDELAASLYRFLNKLTESKFTNKALERVLVVLSA